MLINVDPVLSSLSWFQPSNMSLLHKKVYLSNNNINNNNNVNNNNSSNSYQDALDDDELEHQTKLDAMERHRLFKADMDRKLGREETPAAKDLGDGDSGNGGSPKMEEETNLKVKINH